MIRNLLLASAMTLGLCTPVLADNVGKPLPAVELDGLTQSPASSFDELAGRALLIEFFAYWWGPCGGAVPHLNDLEDEFGPQGLTVVGVTSEGESQTEPWVESKGARYAYAYDRGGKLKNALGVSGIPNAVLVDPSGTILWQGHPSNLTNALVEEAIKGSITTPVYEWGGSAKGIKKAFLKGDFAKALKEADKLAEDEELGTEIGTMLRKMVADRVASYEADLERGDVLKAYDGAKALASGIKGLPEEERISALLKTISKDKELKAALKAQTKLIEISALELRRKKDCDASIKQLEKLMKGFEGTRTGDLISEALKSVQATKGKLPR